MFPEVKAYGTVSTTHSRSTERTIDESEKNPFFLEKRLVELLLIPSQAITSSQHIPTNSPRNQHLVLVEEGLELGSGSSGLALGELLLTKTGLGESSGVGVEAEKDLLVAERVLLLDVGALLDGTTLGGAEDRLNLGRVDELGNVGLGNRVLGKEEVLLESRGLSGGAVDLVKGLESGRGPDNEAAEVTTRGELEEVEGEDGASLNTGDVAESGNELLAILAGVVDNEGTTALAVAAVSQLTLTGTELLGSLDLLEVSTGTDGLEEGDGSGGLGDGSVAEGGRVDDERDLRNGGDLVTTGHQESGGGRGSNGRGGSETLLAKVDLLLPLAPDLGGGEHATGTAHVTEGGLTGTVSTTTGDTGDTGNSTAWKGIVLGAVFLAF